MPAKKRTATKRSAAKRTTAKRGTAQRTGTPREVAAAPQEAGSMSARAVATAILKAKKRMPAKELIEKTLADPRTRPMAGKTPAATLAAQLYVAAKSPEKTHIAKADKGVFEYVA